ncbi:MAG TPA: CoA transferase [Steroidobacteraceae bacterium]|nr:CoA transferase [Steroidobacteraceae bacterium]HNS28290.1 CoA transferase [Steroidobacteraceae bacterium]
MSAAGGTDAARASLPLAGIRVLTFENFGAGPFGSMYLADLGAEVIKIENRDQGGDATRGMGPFFLGENDSHFFQTFNLNKRSVTLNLKTEAGQAVFRRLVARSDAVLNNLRGDQPEKLGLTYAALADVNPRIVCAHLSAYGRDNERKGWPGYDYLMQAEAGYLHLTGEPGSPPARMGLSIVDYMTGITTAVALLASLLGAMKTGRGRDIDVSLFDVALHQLSYPGTWFINERHRTERMPRSSHPSATPVQLLRTQDGWIFVMCMTEKFWHELLAVLGAQALGHDPRFATMQARREHRPELTAALDAIFETDTTSAWLARLQGRLPAAPVYNMEQALDNPFVERIGMIQATPHPQKPGFRALANPIKLDGQRLHGRIGSALGADTRDVLREIGYEDAEIDALASQRVI